MRFGEGREPLRKGFSSLSKVFPTSPEKKETPCDMRNLAGRWLCGSDAKDGKLYILMIRHKAGGHRSFPKGHMEKGETETDTAEREVMEETAVRIPPDTGEGVPGEPCTITPCRA